MKIDLKKERFESIEDAFRDLQEKKNVSNALRKIKSNLKETFPDKNINITIIDNKLKKEFFIMSVFPDISTIDTIVDAIISEKNDDVIRKIWNGSDTWTVEIDSKILYEKVIDTNAKELTALLLHELGHIVYSNSIPQRISRVMRLEYARAGMHIKALMKDRLFKQILRLPIINACLYDNYKTKDMIKKELKADVFVVKMGYADELNTVLTKLIALSNTPKNAEINSDSQDVYADMKSVTLFSINTLEQFKERKTNVIKQNFKKLLLSSPSEFVQKNIEEISDKLIKSSMKDSSINESTKCMVVSNLANKIIDDMYMTEFFDNKAKRLKKFDPTDIDYIELEKNNIKSNDDKMLLISYIHTKLDTITYYLAIIDSNNSSYSVPHTRESLIAMKNKLEKLKAEIMAYKIPEPKYGLFVAYPDGYEG